MFDQCLAKRNPDQLMAGTSMRLVVDNAPDNPVLHLRSPESKEYLEATAQVNNAIFMNTVNQLQDLYQDRSKGEMTALRKNLEALAQPATAYILDPTLQSPQ
jgi:hypothetical protein